MTQRIRYGAGGATYIEKVKPEEPKQEAPKVEPKKEKKKKKIIQEIMGEDLIEEKETLDEIV
tara:strand:+ start:269 stop:454 length:186 start_codon:yes stop_codon:yes gene_type:complete